MFAFPAGSGRVLGLAGNRRATASFPRHLHVVTIEAPYAVPRGSQNCRYARAGFPCKTRLTRFVSESHPSSSW